LAAVSQADTLCFYLFLLMRQGVRGTPRAGNAGGVRSSQLAGLWTAACDAGIDRIPAVFGLPFDTDTWNSFTWQP